ncbi:MAG: endo-1,4-beta-xylanase [Bacteroidales bacterium]|nr:endo-1,4-beta-xylanase [Bacteroidales bacterium]
MEFIFLKKFSFLFFLFFLVGCNSQTDELQIETPVEEESDLVRPTNLDQYNQVTEGLKDYYKDYFYIGAAIEPNALDNANDVKLLKRHFNSLTAENVMKWSSLQPIEGTFRFENADKILAFAQENGMQVRGHTLCWHNQVPDWIFKDGANTASKELVLQRLRTHINTVITHFKGKVYAWDVVNEVIADDSNIYRSSKWYGICGEDFIIEAFKAARAADPNAKLFYNDYSATNATKRDKIYNLLKKLKDLNLVDGMGLQGHWNISAPSNELIIAAFDKYKSLGIELQITEFDVSVYTSNSQTQSSFTSELSQQQTLAYARFFNLFRIYKNDITGVTFWGVADNHTWLDTYPVTTGRKNYPFLFGTDYNPKQAYFTVIDF